MSKFENRESSTLNYKILDVKSVNRDESGEIISMEVEVIRNDTPKEGKEGTPLNAESLNEIIKQMIHDQIYMSDEDKVKEDKEKLTIKSYVSDNFTLPTLGYNHSLITWSVVYGGNSISINLGNATIVKSSQNTEVTLRATISNGEAVSSKLFNVIILADSTNAVPTDFSPKNYNICWPQIKGTLKSNVLTIISNDGTKLYARVVNENSDKIDINVTTNSSNTIKISINEKEELNQMQGYTNLLLDFTVDIYFDSNRTYKIGTLYGNIEYDFESTTPED